MPTKAEQIDVWVAATPERLAALERVAEAATTVFYHHVGGGSPHWDALEKAILELRRRERRPET
jgi:hypothetical protein